MKPSEEIIRELQAVAPNLSGLDRLDFVSAPDGYFHTFSSRMMELALAKPESEPALNSVSLNALNREMKTSVPEGYFSSFSATLLKKIKNDELSAIAPTLAGMPKVNHFEAPIGYFDSFPMLTAGKVTTKTENENGFAKMLRSANTVFENLVAYIFRPQFTLAFAGTASMVIVGALMLYQIELQQCKDFYCQLQNVSEEELNAYFEDNADEFGESILDASTKDVEQLNPGTLDESTVNQLTDEDWNKAVLD